MELSLEELKTQLIQDVVASYTARVQGCATKEEVKACSREVIQQISQKTILGEQANVGQEGQPQDLS